MLTVVISASCGFFTGTYYARTAPQRALKQACRSVSKLYAVILEKLDLAQEVCGILETSSAYVLQADQLEQLHQRQSRLLETLTNITLRDTHSPDEDVCAADPIQPGELVVEWIKGGEDSETELPSRAAFEENLALLVARGRQARSESGLLLVKADRLAQLKSRLGSEQVRILMKRMAGVICRAIRDEDLVCRYNAETFAVLIPGVDRESGQRVAEAVRSSIRHYKFRVDESSHEVLLTASLGYATCHADDHLELVVNRAGDALSASQRLGRNQLHAYDGSELVQCQAS